MKYFDTKNNIYYSFYLIISKQYCNVVIIEQPSRYSYVVLTILFLI